jgi:DNA-binding CsgD family transcriptional regulator
MMERRGRFSEGFTMDLAPIVRAVEVLAAPMDWGSQDAWLAECLRRVRLARCAPASPAPGGTTAELEALLRLPGDETGWLWAALEAAPGEQPRRALPFMPEVTAEFLPILSLRCALAAGLARLERLTPALPTTRELRLGFGLRGREPQVALLAAEGLSNADIARRLSLSAHTVRHYLERVLDRLGLHSRKALALHLMNGERRD